MAERIGYGLIGAGAFGQFCLEQYRQMDEVRVVAIADANADAAKGAAAKLGVEACGNVAELLSRGDIDLVHIATPPFTHRDIAVQALERGKHVLCEKPLAVTLADAQEMARVAEQRQRLLAVNLIMRYNPLCAAVKQVMDERLLGEPLHGFFENYAKDEPLGPQHWFWSREKSGGIFVEHGVHFFDLYRWWLGDGDVVAAQQVARPGSGPPEIQEQVQCTVRHGDGKSGVYVNHYHGFTQAARMDRQEMRILCERGSIQLFEWVPTRAVVTCLADRKALDRLVELLPDAKVASSEPAEGDARQVTSRHKRYAIDGKYEVHATAGMDKPALYGHVVRALLADQAAAIRDPRHARRITEESGLTSLATAVRASELAA